MNFKEQHLQQEKNIHLQMHKQCLRGYRQVTELQKLPCFNFLKKPTPIILLLFLHYCVHTFLTLQENLISLAMDLYSVKVSVWANHLSSPIVAVIQKMQ